MISLEEVIVLSLQIVKRAEEAEAKVKSLESEINQQKEKIKELEIINKIKEENI